MGFLAWIVVGLIAGWLAGQVMKGGGYGVLVDIPFWGVLGGVLGGWVLGMLGVWPGGGMIGSIIVAFVGAVILVWITRYEKGLIVEATRAVTSSVGLPVNPDFERRWSSDTEPRIFRHLGSRQVVAGL